MSSDLPSLIREESWVGMDVNMAQLMEEEEASSMPDSAEVSEGEGINQNADKPEHENSSMGADLQENSGIEQQLASGEKLVEPEDSTIQNPSEEIAPTEENLVPDDATRDMGENLLEPELAHVIVDEEFDFDQFGTPPPDLPIIGGSDNEQRGGIGSLNGEKRASGSTEVMKPEDQITDLDADNGFEQDMKNLNDGSVNTSLTNTEEKEQLLIERDPESGVDPKPAEDNTRFEVHRALDTELTGGIDGTSDPKPADYEVHRSLDTELTGGIDGTSELREPETVNPENIGDDSSERALRSSNIKTEVEGSSAQEEIQKRAEDLNQLTQEQAKQLEDIRHQVYLSNAQLEEQSEIHEELKRKLEAECDERVRTEAKLMVLHEILPNMEEKLKNLADQVEFLEIQLQEQADSRNKLKNDLQHERTEKTQCVTQLKEKTRLHEELAKALDEERDGRLKSEGDLMVLGEMFTNVEEKMKDLSDQVDSLIVQLQEQIELRKSLEEKLDWECKEKMQCMIKLEEQSKMHEELSLKVEGERNERLESEKTHLEELRGSVSNEEEKLKDLHNQVVSLTAQLQEQKELKKELEGKWDHERDAVTLPVSSMPLSDEKLEFAKLLDEQKTLLANQVQEAERLKNAAEMKVGLLNHQVQNLEVLSDIVETMEYVFSAKERVFKQALWTVFQALCLGVGLMSFVVAYRDPLRSSLQPT